MAGTSLIRRVTARQILDSRGRPTVEADVVLENGVIARACAPSGASTGRHEACELRDGDADHFEGLGVLRAVGNVQQEVQSRIAGMDARDQKAVDAAMIELDGTPSLKRLGANGILATSLAVSRAAALHEQISLHRYISSLAGGTAMSLPMPMTNILSGGAHAGRGMDIQDFLVIPVGAKSYSQALSMIARVRSSATKLMAKRGLTVLLADEGGLSPGFARAEQALELMVRSFEEAGLSPGSDVAIALDVAASELFDEGAYTLTGEGQRFSSPDMASFLTQLIGRFPIISVEDPLDQDDWSAWQGFTRDNKHIQVVGDDLFVTNPDRIARGAAENVANTALIKVNQNGTLTGTLAAMAMARKSNYATVVSARSGETEDAYIADLAVGTGGGQIKIGSVRNSERLAKYNQLLRIEEEDGLPFAGIAGLGGTPQPATA